MRGVSPRVAVLLGLALTSALVLLTPPSRAQEARRAKTQDERGRVDGRDGASGAASGNLDKARTLFRQARRLAAGGNFSEACPKFEQSLALERGIGTKYNLADCWEKLGRVASAYSMFLSAAEDASKLEQYDRAQIARKRAAELKPRVSYLLITVGLPATGIKIQRGDVELSESAWGRPLPTDPGSYVIKVRAPGRKEWSAPVDVAEGAGTISVTVPPLEAASRDTRPRPRPAPVAKRQAVARSKPAPVRALPREPEPPPERHALRASSSGLSGGRLVAVSMGVAGVIALGAGTVFALEYSSADNDARAICPSGRGCSRAEISDHSELVDDSRAARNRALLAFGLGGSALSGATTLYFASGSKEKAARVDAGLFVGATGQPGAMLRGRF